MNHLSVTPAPKFYYKRVVDGVFLLGIVLAILGLTYFYMSSERFFYYWDYGGYYGVTVNQALDFRESPLSALVQLWYSLNLDYNYVFTVLLAPFIWMWGESRLVYVFGVALVYQLPLMLLVSALATKLIPCCSRVVFWSTALLGFFIPVFWAPTLYGYPDAGAAALITLAVWIYWRDMDLKAWWQIGLIGFCLAVAMIFRRHFAYGGTAFLVAVTLQAGFRFLARVWQQPRQAWLDLFTSGLRIGLIGITVLSTLAILAWPFFINALTQDYSILYSSYAQSPGELFWYYLNIYSWPVWSLALLGLFMGLFTRTLSPVHAGFVILYGTIALTQWIFMVHYISPNYTLHFTPFIVLGLTALGWTIWLNHKKRVHIAVLGLIIVYLILNTVNSLSAWQLFDNVHSFFSSRFPPRVRNDYSEVVRLVDYLRATTSPRTPIFVASSSGWLNDDLLFKAEQALYGPEHSTLNILFSPHIDSRDYYPLEGLLRSDYVAIAEPFQYHQSVEEQDVVKVVVDAFAENWEIARDFTRLPPQFSLGNGVTVNIYQRIHPTTLATALRTYAAMQDYVGARPGNQPDWIIFSEFVPSSITKSQDSTYRIWTHASNKAEGPQSMFLYMGELPAQGEVTGTLIFQDDKCVGVSVGIGLLDAQSKIIELVEQSIRPDANSINFTLPFHNSQASSLYLYVSNVGDEPIYNCTVAIEQLSPKETVAKELSLALSEWQYSGLELVNTDPSQYELRVTGEDPISRSPVLNLPAEDYNYLIVKVILSPPIECKILTFYFTTNGAPTESELRSIYIPYNPSPISQNYVFPVYLHPEWRGLISTIRLDPVCGLNSDGSEVKFQIESVTLH